MVFSKSFPRTTDKSSYPQWEEIFLTSEEESKQEDNCRTQNIILMKECVDDAKNIFLDKNLKDFQSDIIKLASVLQISHYQEFRNTCSAVSVFGKQAVEEVFNALLITNATNLSKETYTALTTSKQSYINSFSAEHKRVPLQYVLQKAKEQGFEIQITAHQPGNTTKLKPMFNIQKQIAKIRSLIIKI